MLIYLTPLGSVAAQGGFVAAEENTVPPADGAEFARGWPIIRLEAVAAPSISHGPRPSLWAFQFVLQIARASLIVRRSVGITYSNRRVRTRTRSGVAGIRG
jgi:hypothetical protein